MEIVASKLLEIFNEFLFRKAVTEDPIGKYVKSDPIPIHNAIISFKFLGNIVMLQLLDHFVFFFHLSNTSQTRISVLVAWARGCGLCKMAAISKSEPRDCVHSALKSALISSSL